MKELYDILSIFDCLHTTSSFLGSNTKSMEKIEIKLNLKLYELFIEKKISWP